MPQFLTLLATSLRLEFRVRETAMLLFTLTVLLSVVGALGVGAAFLDPQAREKVCLSLVWINFVVTASVAVGRSLEYEVEHRAWDGLWVSGVSPSQFFLAKVLSNFTILLAGQLIGIVSLSIFTNALPGSAVRYLLLISVPVVLAYSSLATLLSAVTLGARLRQFILPVILLPLVFPLFFGALELSFAALIDGSLKGGDVWGSLLLFLNVLYLGLGVALFPQVIRD